MTPAARRPGKLLGKAGYVMPAEWEPHEATWLAWPHNVTDWPGRFGPIPWVYTEIIRHLTSGERVELAVKGATHERRVRRILSRGGIDLGQVVFRRLPTNRIWMRDFGPLFVRKAGRTPSLAVARFRFNAWAKYPDWQKDDQIPERAAAALQLTAFPARHRDRPVVLEGGSIDVNGAGTILTTEECLLHPSIQVRNPGFSREDWQQVFADWLGAPHTIWLGQGIAGDDTHGHVDDLARFVDQRTIVVCREPDPRDANHEPLEDNWRRLARARLQDGRRPRVVALPMPAPLVFDGQRLPASYANFYIANGQVLVPTFNDPQDRVALGILADLFPGRRVVGIHAVDLVWGLGTLHCLSQQQPRA